MNANKCPLEIIPSSAEDHSTYLTPSEISLQSTTHARTGEVERKTGRPTHPAWEHFVRGEKRNRNHHNAYCKHCTANGIVPCPVRGVSGNMIRHLQLCQFCPKNIVQQLKATCAQRDAEHYSKKHYAYTSDVESIFQENMLRNKRKWKSLRGVEDASTESEIGKKSSQGTTLEDLIPYQIGNGTQDTNHADTAMSRRSIAFDKNLKSEKECFSQSALKYEYGHIETGVEKCADKESQRQLLKAALAVNVPLDWMVFEANVSDTFERIRVASQYRYEITDSAHEAYLQHEIVRLRRLRTNVTLSIRLWRSLRARNYFALFSLSAIGLETILWNLFDLGIDRPTHDHLVSRIEDAVVKIEAANISISSVVVDSSILYRAANAFLRKSHKHILLFPCFTQFLVTLIGTILTYDESYIETVAQIFELTRDLSRLYRIAAIRQKLDRFRMTFELSSMNNVCSLLNCIECLAEHQNEIEPLFRNNVEVIDPSSPQGRSENLKADSSVASGSNRLSDGFWENLQCIFRLLQPIQKFFRASNFEAHIESSVHLPTLLYQLGDLRQEYDDLLVEWREQHFLHAILGLIESLQSLLEDFWGLFDQPLVFLSCFLHEQTAPERFNRDEEPNLRWISIGRYCAHYFRSWVLKDTLQKQADDGCGESKILEELLQLKQQKLPFGQDMMNVYNDTRIFYQFLSDSCPNLHLLAAKIFDLRLSTTNVCHLLPDMSLIPTQCRTVLPRSVLLAMAREKLQYCKKGDKLYPARTAPAIAREVHSRHLEQSPAEIWTSEYWMKTAERWREHLNGSDKFQDTLESEKDMIIDPLPLARIFSRKGIESSRFTM